MANRKINELSVRTPSLTDLMIVGDPSTGYSFKATLAALNTLIDSSTSIGDLNGVVITSPTNGQALVYNGTNWVNQSISVPVTSVFGRTGAVVATEGDYSLDLLSDVTLTTPSSNQVLQYNGTAWVNATLTDNGITSLNGLTALSQTFATGSSGTDFAISSTTSTHTFNLPTASAVNRGALSSADWSTFNAKQDAITLTTTGSSGSATLVGSTLNVPTYTLAGLGGITLSSLSASAPLSYNNGTGAFSITQASGSTDGYLSSTDWNTFNNKQNALTNPVTGTGTTNYLPKWTGSTALGNSLVFDNGTNVGIGTASPGRLLQVNGTVQLGTPVVGASAASSTVIIDRQSNTNNLVLSSGNGDNSIRFRNYVETVLGQINFSSTGLGLGTNGNSQDLIIFRTTNRVGIGTTVDAGYRLDVSGTFRSTLDANINGLTVGKGGGSVATNTAVGVSAISATATGTQNTAIGNTALRDVTSGFSNTAIGMASARAVTSGADNSYLGYAAGIVSTTGNRNTSIGAYSGYALTTSNNNTFLGWFSGGDITTGGNNTIIGENSGRGITTGNNNTIIGAEVSGLSASLSNTIILADGQGNQRLYINSSGEAMIGSTTDQGDFKLQVTGQQVIQGVLTAGSPFPNFGYVGVLELKSSNQNALSVYGIKFNNTNTGTAFIGISADNASAYSRPSKSIIHKADGHVFYNSSDVNLFSIFPSTGNISVNSATDAGYKLDVNGTLKASGSVGFGGSNPDGTYNFNCNGLFRFVNGSAFFGNSAGNLAMNNMGAIINNNTSNFNFLGQVSGTNTGQFTGSATAVSLSSITNIPLRFLTNNSEVGRFAANGSFAIGTTSPNASALLDITSTTKGFLPPRMTNAQMVAIGTPASGLMVYDTTNNKLNVYDGTNWVAVH